MSSTRCVSLPDDLPTRSVDDDIKGPIDADGLADVTAKAGIAALEGLPGPMRESLVYGAAIYLQHLGIFRDPTAAAKKVREVLDSGEASRRLEFSSR